MQNVQATSLVNTFSVPPVNNSKAVDQSSDFQQYMKNAGGTAKSTNNKDVGTEKKVFEPEQSSGQVTVKDSAEQNVVSEGQELPKEELSKQEIDAVEKSIRDTIKDVLHIDDETLDRAMAEIGISLLQLLDPNILQEFLITLSPGSDVTDFLTSESMLQDFTELVQAMEEIDWEELTGMSKEEFVQQLEIAMQEDGTDSQPVIQPDGADSQPVVQPDAEMHEGILEESLVPVEEDILAEQMPENPQTKVVQEVLSPQKEAVRVDDSHVVETEEAVVETQQATEAVVQTESGLEENSSQSQLPQQTDAKLQREIQPQDNQSVTVMNFVENMMQAVKDSQPVDAVKMQQMIDIVNQVVEKIQSSVTEGTTTMEMQLNPESLGKVLLTVSNRDGIMTASFTVQSAEAKEALESQMINLRETLEQKNLKVESVEVSVSDFTFSQKDQTDTNDQKNFNQGHGKRMPFQEESEEEEAQVEAEQVRRSVMRDTGSSVDFTA